MKYISLYENWMRSSEDKDLVEVADYIDDILLDVGDMDFPYYNKTMISRDQIMFEISATSDNSITDDKFELTNEVISIIKRCDEYVESVGYQMEIYFRWDVIKDATIGEHVEGEGGGIMTLQGLQDYIGKEIHYIGVTVRRKYPKINEELESIPGIPSKDIIGKESDIKSQIKHLHKVPKELKNIATTLTQYITNAKNGKISGLKLHPDLEKRVKDGEYPSGYSMGVDKDGYYIHTHRARSKSYESPDKIPVKDMKFIDSTG